jgi:cytochrome c peroxidase
MLRLASQAAKRFNSSQTSKRFNSSQTSSSGNWLMALATLGGGAAGYYYYESTKPVDYKLVYQSIASKLDNSDYDDGSYGPLLVRLAWHAAGTYDKDTKTGGSNGATMRFEPESKHGANAGLAVARNLLEDVKKQFPNISYADLWSLAGVVSIQEMGGPVIPWRPGRIDKSSGNECTPDGRLPDASKTQDHVAFPNLAAGCFLQNGI